MIRHGYSLAWSAVAEALLTDEPPSRRVLITAGRAAITTELAACLPADTTEGLTMPTSTHRPNTRYASPEEKWRALVAPADDGHLEWRGPRNDKGTPTLHLRGAHHSPLAMAFRMRTGRDPIGPARADCGHPGCVAPDHVEDTPGRNRARAVLRAIAGRAGRPEVCPRGHGQAEWGRLRADGRAYCLACRRGDSQPAADR